MRSVRSPLPSLLVFAALSCGDATGQFSRVHIDPNLPREDPTSYPDNPVVSVPPVIACPFEARNGCPDVWAGNASDAGAWADARGDSDFVDGFVDADDAQESGGSDAGTD